MISDERRQQRVAEGSRRKRDLAAVGDDLNTYRAKHFPDENRYQVNQAYHKVWVLNGRKGTPSPEDVRAMMKALSCGA